jgi:hypothetical protein
MTDTDTLALIAALLRKAESTTSEHEREVAMSRAQVLASRHSIDLAVARAHSAKAEKRETPEERGIRVGFKGQKGLNKFVRLYLAIAEANDVRCLVSHDSTWVFPYGFPSDIDMVGTLYESLVVQMVGACEAFLASPERSALTEERYDDWRGVWVTKKVHGSVVRRSFYDGFTSRIGRRLRDARTEAEAAAVASDVQDPQVVPVNGLPVSTALVLADKKAEVAAFLEEAKVRRGVRGTWRGGSRRYPASSSTARVAGRDAADRARVRDQNGPAGISA